MGCLRGLALRKPIWRVGFRRDRCQGKVKHRPESSGMTSRGEKMYDRRGKLNELDLGVVRGEKTIGRWSGDCGWDAFDRGGSAG
jgi:hypothetical protein